MTKIHGILAVGTAAVLAAAAYGGEDSSGNSGSTVSARSEQETEEVTFGDRAAQGLKISPVTLNTKGASEHQKKMIGLGSYIVNAASDCAVCHSGSAGFMSGGNPFALDGAGHVVWTRNLTPDPATGLALTLDQFKEAIRTGRDFHAGATVQLIVMPWTTLRWSSDRDLEAIYAYLKAIPAINNTVPPDNKSDLPLPASTPFPKNSYTDGDVVRPLDFDHSSFSSGRGLEISPRAQPTKLRGSKLEAYGLGSYIANSFTHCNDCHTHPDRTSDFSHINTPDFLTGGTVFKVPPPLQPVLKQVRAMSANLKGAQHGFFGESTATYETFRTIIKTGTHADETPARPLGFPMVLVAANLANLLENDLFSVYTYVHNLPTTSGPSDVDQQTYTRLCAVDSDCMTGEICATATQECIGGPCSSDADCGACQTCGAGKCQAPAADSVCLATSQ